jgi:hypothetical protein
MSIASLVSDRLQAIDQEILTAKHQFHDDYLHIERTTNYFVDQAHSRYSFTSECTEKREFHTGLQALESKLHMFGVIDSCLAVILKIPGAVEEPGALRSNHSPSSIALPPKGQPGEFVQYCTHTIDALISERNRRRSDMLTNIQHVIENAWTEVSARLGPSFANRAETHEKRDIYIKSEAFKSRHDLICLAISICHSNSRP